ncbi:RE2, partial [Symbiodinium sp. CCMP2456]
YDYEETNGDRPEELPGRMVDDEDDDEDGVATRQEDIELEDGVPEEVATAYATYQSAKDRYKEQQKARGFHGDRGGGYNKDNAKKAELTRDEKVKLMKSRSYCSSCGQKGHWHRDQECPNQGGGGAGNRTVKEVEVCHHVAAEVFSLRHDGPTLLGITDTACAKAVAGTIRLQQYSDALEKVNQRPQLVRESEAFRFGTGKVHHSSFHVVLSFKMGQHVVEMRTSIINGDVPLLMSKQALAQLGMIYDVAENRADFTRVGVFGFDLVTTSSGHPAIPIVPAKPANDLERLVIGETSTSTGQQYMAFAVSVVHQANSGNARQSTPGPDYPTAPPFRIFHDKKLSPEVKELLTQIAPPPHCFLPPRSMACKPPAISKMSKTELLSEASRLGLVVHRSWTVEEIKATIMEHRMNDPAYKQAATMKSITNLTLHELKEKADTLGVQYPAKITKGNLLRLIRDFVSTPGTELMKIGRYKGFEFQEIPRQYGMWAAREIRMSPNPHPELIRYAKWWEQYEYEIHYGDGDTLEANATVPYTEDATQWSVSSGTEGWDKVSDKGQSHAAKDLPIDPRANKRATSSSGYDPEVMNAMETEMDPATLEEIIALETRLAALKQKAKAAPGPTKEETYGEELAERYVNNGARRLLHDQDLRQGHVVPAPHERRVQDSNYKSKGDHFGNKTYGHTAGCCGYAPNADLNHAYITNEEFEISAKRPATNFKCSPVNPCAEDGFSIAYKNQDYDYKTLQILLNTLDYKPVKAARDGVFGGKTGDYVNYFTYGMFTHGGVVGTTTKTREDDNVIRFLNGFGRHHLGPKATWASVSLSRDIATELHHDYRNLAGTSNYTISVGQRSGGGLWIEDRSLDEDAPKDGIKWRKTGSGHWLPGRVHVTKNNFVEFDPFLKHATEPWEGTRWTLTYHTTRNIYKAGDEMRGFLKGVGFPLPRKGSTGPRPNDVSKKPRMSFNNAAKIGVMMATLISAASSYMTEHVLPDSDPNPVVLFEIGGTEATYDAVTLGKDVFEPMTWERYRLVKQQVGEGGTAVITGPAKDVIFHALNTDVDFKDTLKYADESHDRIFAVIFREKEEAKAVSCSDRVHDVKMVAANSGDPDKERLPAMGATGISFGKDTPSAVATALRRLHQNLGHPRQEDLVRHLRLAGCDSNILKAARSMKCQVCDANAAPKIARPSTLPPMADFNDTLGLDLFFCHDIDDVKHAFLSVIDYGTSYHLATRVDGQSAEDIEAKFNEMWLLPFGPPKAVVIDLEGGLQAALGRMCDWHGIAVRSVATQSHWQAGVVERQQAWWKHIWDKVSYQLNIGDDEVDAAVPVINSAKNDLRRRCGYSPSQWVFGKAPRVPEDLQDPDGGSHVLWDVSEDAKYQRQAAMRAAARVAFHESQTDSRLRKALLQRTRVASRPLDIGESVHFWHKPKNRRRGCWSGPAVIVGKEGGNYWVSKGGRCRLTSAEHLRPTTAEEVGALLSMRNTQREVEQLLDHDPDGDEAYGEDVDYADDMSWNEDNEDGELEDYLIPSGDEAPMLEPFQDEDPPDPPPRRLKRKTAAAELHPSPDRHEAMMLKTQLTTRGLEKRKEKELKWTEIPEEVRDKFREAEQTQWNEHLAYDALEPLSLEDSARIKDEVAPERVLRCRWAYRDKNYARRRQGEDVPWKCKSRLVIAGHTDPDLTDESMRLSTDAPTLSRSGLACMLQRTADGLRDSDPWTLAAGDIRCAFLTGSYLTRELFMHQPRTGFPGMVPGQLVRIKKNVFGLATSPHTWWQDLQDGIRKFEINYDHEQRTGTWKFDQSPMDPCVFMLREWRDGGFVGKPIAYLGCHVDDLLIAAARGLQPLIQKGLSEIFPIETWEIDEFEFLGSKISIEDDVARMNQQKYAETRLFTLDIPAGVDEGDFAPAELVSDNRSLIGALSWMSGQTRPDLTCSVSMAQQLQKAPTYGDLKFTNTIAAKAYQFRDRGLEFKAIPEGHLMLVAYHDAAWANVPDPDPEETWYVLTPNEDEAGRQREGPYAQEGVRRAKKGNSKVASQLGVLVTFTDRAALAGRPGNSNVGDWRSRAGQRICRSTFGAETQACAEGLETAQYLRSMYETMIQGHMVTVEAAVLPILCLSDCRSLYDHLNRQGIPRVPSDKRLAVDLAALRQGLRSEKWGDQLPIGWIPGTLQRSDILTKPQNPSEWWNGHSGRLTLPVISNRGSLHQQQVVFEGIWYNRAKEASADAQADRGSA